MGHLASAKAQRNFDLVAFFEELDQLAELDLVVALVGARAELDLLDLDLLLLELGLVRLLLLTVAEFAVIHELADRRLGKRRNLHQIDLSLFRQPQRLGDRHDSKLLSIVRDQTHLRCGDLPVETLRFVECYEGLSSASGW